MSASTFGIRRDQITGGRMRGVTPARGRWARMAIAACLAVIAGCLMLWAPAAKAAPPGQGFTVSPADLEFILKQIKIAEAHVANTTSATGPCGALVGTGPNQIPSPLLSIGLRTVDGTCNNLQPGQEKFGAADEIFPRLTDPVFKTAETMPANLFGPGSPAGSR